MKEYLTIIESSPLFQGINTSDLEKLFRCLSPVRADFCKNEFVLHTGNAFSSMGLVLFGCVHIIEEDFWGNRSLLAEIQPGELFGETYACLPDTPLEISAVCAERCCVLFLDTSKITTVCRSACVFHARLIQNLMQVLAEKNLLLTRKIGYLTRRNTREKLLCYLSTQAKLHGSAAFAIPFNRQQLADYLSVDRSAMSNELSKMRADGILDYHKNEFVIKREETV